MIRIVVEPGARADVFEAVRFYNSRAAGLGARFRQRFQEVLEIVQRHPGAFAERELGLRWALLRQFPYKVYYLLSGELCQVVAVIHAHARPAPWMSGVGVPEHDDE